MAYVTPTTKATGQLISSAIWNQDVVSNMLHLASLQIGSAALGALASGTNIGAVLGTYTGNGAATQAITGVGFQPRAFMIFPHTTTIHPLQVNNLMSAGSDGTFINNFGTGRVQSIDANGFTVQNATGGGGAFNPNANTIVYSYIAWR